eukprot:g3668.t1
MNSFKKRELERKRQIERKRLLAVKSTSKQLGAGNSLCDPTEPKSFGGQRIVGGGKALWKKRDREREIREDNERLAKSVKELDGRYSVKTLWTPKPGLRLNAKGQTLVDNFNPAADELHRKRGKGVRVVKHENVWLGPRISDPPYHASKREKKKALLLHQLDAQLDALHVKEREDRVHHSFSSDDDIFSSIVKSKGSVYETKSKSSKRTHGVSLLEQQQKPVRRLLWLAKTDKGTVSLMKSFCEQDDNSEDKQSENSTSEGTEKGYYKSWKTIADIDGSSCIAYIASLTALPKKLSPCTDRPESDSEVTSALESAVVAASSKASSLVEEPLRGADICLLVNPRGSDTFYSIILSGRAIRTVVPRISPVADLRERFSAILPLLRFSANIRLEIAIVFDSEKKKKSVIKKMKNAFRSRRERIDGPCIRLTAPTSASVKDIKMIIAKAIDKHARQRVNVDSDKLKKDNKGLESSDNTIAVERKAKSLRLMMPLMPQRPRSQLRDDKYSKKKNYEKPQNNRKKQVRFNRQMRIESRSELPSVSQTQGGRKSRPATAGARLTIEKEGQSQKFRIFRGKSGRPPSAAPRPRKKTRELIDGETMFEMLDEYSLGDFPLTMDVLKEMKENKSKDFEEKDDALDLLKSKEMKEKNCNRKLPSKGYNWWKNSIGSIFDPSDPVSTTFLEPRDLSDLNLVVRYNFKDSTEMPKEKKIVMPEEVSNIVKLRIRPVLKEHAFFIKLNPFETTAEELMDLIEEQEGTPKECQRLCYNGSILSSSKVSNTNQEKKNNLASCYPGINDSNSTVYLIRTPQKQNPYKLPRPSLAFIPSKLRPASAPPAKTSQNNSRFVRPASAFFPQKVALYGVEKARMKAFQNKIKKNEADRSGDSFILSAVGGRKPDRGERKPWSQRFRPENMQPPKRDFSGAYAQGGIIHLSTVVSNSSLYNGTKTIKRNNRRHGRGRGRGRGRKRRDKKLRRLDHHRPATAPLHDPSQEKKVSIERPSTAQGGVQGNVTLQAEAAISTWSSQESKKHEELEENTFLQNHPNVCRLLAKTKGQVLLHHYGKYDESLTQVFTYAPKGLHLGVRLKPAVKTDEIGARIVGYTATRGQIHPLKNGIVVGMHIIQIGEENFEDTNCYFADIESALKNVEKVGENVKIKFGVPHVVAKLANQQQHDDEIRRRSMTGEEFHNFEDSEEKNDEQTSGQHLKEELSFSSSDLDSARSDIGENEMYKEDLRSPSISTAALSTISSTSSKRPMSAHPASRVRPEHVSAAAPSLFWPADFDGEEENKEEELMYERYEMHEADMPVKRKLYAHNVKRSNRMKRPATATVRSSPTAGERRRVAEIRGKYREDVVRPNSASVGIVGGREKKEKMKKKVHTRPRTATVRSRFPVHEQTQLLNHKTSHGIHDSSKKFKGQTTKLGTNNGRRPETAPAHRQKRKAGKNTKHKLNLQPAYKGSMYDSTKVDKLVEEKRRILRKRIVEAEVKLQDAKQRHKAIAKKKRPKKRPHSSYLLGRPNGSFPTDNFGKAMNILDEVYGEGRKRRHIVGKGRPASAISHHLKNAPFASRGSWERWINDMHVPEELKMSSSSGRASHPLKLSEKYDPNNEFKAQSNLERIRLMVGRAEQEIRETVQRREQRGQEAAKAVTRKRKLNIRKRYYDRVQRGKFSPIDAAHAEQAELALVVKEAERLAESAFEDRRRNCRNWLMQPTRVEAALEAAYSKITEAKRILAVQLSAKNPDSLSKDLSVQRRSAGAALVKAGEARFLLDEELARHMARLEKEMQLRADLKSKLIRDAGAIVSDVVAKCESSSDVLSDVPGVQVQLNKMMTLSASLHSRVKDWSVIDQEKTLEENLLHFQSESSIFLKDLREAAAGVLCEQSLLEDRICSERERRHEMEETLLGPAKEKLVQLRRELASLAPDPLSETGTEGRVEELRESLASAEKSVEEVSERLKNPVDKCLTQDSLDSSLRSLWSWVSEKLDVVTVVHTELDFETKGVSSRLSQERASRKAWSENLKSARERVEKLLKIRPLLDGRPVVLAIIERADSIISDANFQLGVEVSVASQSAMIDGLRKLKKVHDVAAAELDECAQEIRGAREALLQERRAKEKKVREEIRVKKVSPAQKIISELTEELVDWPQLRDGMTEALETGRKAILTVLHSLEEPISNCVESEESMEIDFAKASDSVDLALQPINDAQILLWRLQDDERKKLNEERREREKTRVDIIEPAMHSMQNLLDQFPGNINAFESVAMAAADAESAIFMASDMCSWHSNATMEASGYKDSRSGESKRGTKRPTALQRRPLQLWKRQVADVVKRAHMKRDIFWNCAQKVWTLARAEKVGRDSIESLMLAPLREKVEPLVATLDEPTVLRPDVLSAMKDILRMNAEAEIRFRKDENVENTSNSTSVLHHDWEAVEDEESGDIYYCHKTTGETQWERPELSAKQKENLQENDNEQKDVDVRIKEMVKNIPSLSNLPNCQTCISFANDEIARCTTWLSNGIQIDTRALNRLASTSKGKESKDNSRIRAQEHAHSELKRALRKMNESIEIAGDSIVMALDEVEAERGRLGSRVLSELLQRQKLLRRLFPLRSRLRHLFKEVKERKTEGTDVTLLEISSVVMHLGDARAALEFALSALHDDDTHFTASQNEAMLQHHLGELQQKVEKAELQAKLAADCVNEEASKLRVRAGVAATARNTMRAHTLLPLKRRLDHGKKELLELEENYELEMQAIAGNSEAPMEENKLESVKNAYDLTQAAWTKLSGRLDMQVPVETAESMNLVLTALRKEMDNLSHAVDVFEEKITEAGGKVLKKSKKGKKKKIKWI